MDDQAMHIFIIDDDTVTRRIIKTVLLKNNYQVTEAVSGEDAVERAEEIKPDLILLDVMMSGMDGFETCKKLKTFPEIVDVPVIFLTAKSETNEVVKGLEAGGSDYISKPFRPLESIARIKTHLKIRSLSRQQKENIVALEKANQAKVKLLAISSHDLKNPLSSINGLASYLTKDKAGPINQIQRDIINSIGSASECMLNIVNDLLDLSVLEDNHIKLNLESNNLSELVSQSILLYKIKASEKGIEINFWDYGIPEKMDFDKHQIKRVVENLLSNAIKFSPKDKKISVSIKTENNNSLILVADEGTGIPESEMDKLFKEFSRTSVKPTAGEQSTGLGLSICKKIMLAHEGDIVAENIQNSGCQFTVSLPEKNASPNKTAS